QPAHARLPANGQGMRVEKRRLALDERDVVPAQLLLDHLDLPPDDGFDPGQELRGGGSGRRARPGQAVTSAGAPGVREDRFAEGLTRNRAGVDAHAAHTTTLLDHGGSTAELRRLNRRALTRRAAPD